MVEEVPGSAWGAAAGLTGRRCDARTPVLSWGGCGARPAPVKNGGANERQREFSPCEAESNPPRRADTEAQEEGAARGGGGGGPRRAAQAVRGQGRGIQGLVWAIGPEA